MIELNRVNCWFSHGRSSSSDPDSFGVNPPPLLPPGPLDPSPLDLSNFPPLSSPQPLSSPSQKTLLQTASSTKHVITHLPSPRTIPTTVEIAFLLQDFTTVHHFSMNTSPRLQSTVQMGILNSPTSVEKKSSNITHRADTLLLNSSTGSGIMSLPAAGSPTLGNSSFVQPHLVVTDDQPDLADNFILKSFATSQAQSLNPPSPTPMNQVPATIHIMNPTTDSWTAIMRKASDKTLKRLAPPSYSPTGTPRILIMDDVFKKGTALHKEFVVGFFCGKFSPYGLVQSVLSHMWGKGKKVEIQLIHIERKILVRIPNNFIRQKVLQKRIWHVETTMFHVVAWS